MIKTTIVAVAPSPLGPDAAPPRYRYTVEIDGTDGRGYTNAPNTMSRDGHELAIRIEDRKAKESWLAGSVASARVEAAKVAAEWLDDYAKAAERVKNAIDEAEAAYP